MTRILRKAALITPVLLAGWSATFSQTAEKINVITTATPFLRISPDARAGGMGETGIATSGDINSQFYNVAKYAFAEHSHGIGVNYIPWLRQLGLNDVYLASMAGYYKLDENQTLSGSLRYFSLGNIQLVDNSGNDLAQERPREFAFDAGYTRKLSDRLSLGVALRYIHSNLVGNSSIGNTGYKTGHAFAGDLGLYYQASGWTFGAALSNLGSKISYTTNADQKSFLPANFGIGAGYTWILEDDHKVSVNGEINKLLVPSFPANGTEQDYEEYNKKGVVSSWVNSFDNKAMAYSGGLEYSYKDQFSFRTGYYTDSRSMGKRNYFTAGLGLNYSILGVNFSYLVPSGRGVNVNPLSNTLRFSLLLYPGKID